MACPGLAEGLPVPLPQPTRGDSCFHQIQMSGAEGNNRDQSCAWNAATVPPLCPPDPKELPLCSRVQIPLTPSPLLEAEVRRGGGLVGARGAGMTLASPWVGVALCWFSRLYTLSPIRVWAPEGLLLSAVIVTPWASHGDITTLFSRPA